MNLHPATLLFAWGVLVVLLQPLSASALAWVALLVLPFAVFVARRRTAELVRRARWLFLSITLLFILATPGQRLSGTAGDLGITIEGLLLAFEHVSRLLLLLATLAALHERVGTHGMMTGLHWLLGPIARWRALRERIVVRLMLVLEHVESTPAASWRDWLNHDPPGTDQLSLTVDAMHATDWMVLTLLAGLLVMVGVQS